MRINSVNNATPFNGYLLVRVDSREKGVVSDPKTIDTRDVLEFHRQHDHNFITLTNGDTYEMTAPLGKGDVYYYKLLNAYTAASQSPKVSIHV